MQNLRVGLIQTAITWHDIEDNCARFGAIIASMTAPMDLLLLPEMFTTGFTMAAPACAEGMEGRGVQHLRRWALEKQADVAGSIALREGDRFYNRLVWARPGGELVTYDKRHLFRMGDEDRVYTAGRERTVIGLGGWRIRPFICYDLRFPVWSRTGNPGYDVAVYAANWPARRAAHWKALLRARAIENQCYVIGVNRIGTDGNGISYCGDSAVIDFLGNTLFERGDEECAVTVDLSLDALNEYRASFPAWKDTDDFTLA